VRYSRGTWPRRSWVGAVLAPLAVGRPSTTAMLAAVGGLAVLVESGTKWGRLRRERDRGRFLVEAGIPAAEVVGELVVEDAGADLQ